MRGIWNSKETSWRQMFVMCRSDGSQWPAKQQNTSSSSSRCHLVSAGSVIYRHFSTFSPVFVAVFTTAIALCFRNSARDARCFCGGKCRHNSVENDYCGGKPGLSLPSLILTLSLTANPNPKDVPKPNPNPTDPTNRNQLTTNPSLPPQ